MDQQIKVDAGCQRDLALFNRLRAVEGAGLTQFEAFRMGLEQGRIEVAIDRSIAARVLEELIRAHKIIHNALQLATTEQKIAWADANERELGPLDGATRAHERTAVIVGAGGRV